MKVLTAEQFRELDRYTIEHEPIQSIDLMERAAKALTAELMNRWPKSHRIFVFAGPAGNGGDGLAMARILATNGYSVQAWLFNVKGQLSPDCQKNSERLNGMISAKLTEVTQSFEFPTIEPGDIIIDALFGTGLKRPLDGGFAHVVRKINATRATIVSIDVPSGLMCEDNSANDRSCIIRATLTLTIQMPKFAFLMAENESFVGEWKTVDIQLSPEGARRIPTPFTIMEEKDVHDLLLPRPAFAHKGTMGHALLVTGSEGMAGAAILSATSCLRSGIGKLTLCTAEVNGPILQTAVPEAVLYTGPEKQLPLHTFNAIGIGPGLGQDKRAAELLRRVVSEAKGPLVIDADALNLLALHPDWLHHLPQGSLLTPHPGEMDRLVGECTSSHERLHKAIQLATDNQLYVILKGHYTAICSPEGRVAFCPAGNAGMATAGSGDVLTGILAGLLAQGYTPSETAQIGVWLHATAGDSAADELTENCLLARDIIQHLPSAFKKLQQTK